MNNLFEPSGTTPFEKALDRLNRGQIYVKSASSLQELLKVVEECDVMIDCWKQELKTGSVSEETRMLATEALKEKRACNAIIDGLVAMMLEHFPAEA